MSLSFDIKSVDHFTKSLSLGWKNGVIIVKCVPPKGHLATGWCSVGSKGVLVAVAGSGSGELLFTTKIFVLL